MKKILVIAGLVITGACTTQAEPLPQKGQTTSDSSKAVSTCDVAREAFLTGTQAEIDAAMTALKNDRTADATAREYADYYMNRDKTNPELREMDKGLIQMSCSI